jgi:hypothetical protein
MSTLVCQNDMIDVIYRVAYSLIKSIMCWSFTCPFRNAFNTQSLNFLTDAFGHTDERVKHSLVFRFHISPSFKPLMDCSNKIQQAKSALATGGGCVLVHKSEVDDRVFLSTSQQCALYTRQAAHGI